MSSRSTSQPRDVREGDQLTARERQILALVATGETTSALSERLGIAEATIKTHLTRIYKKTGSTNRVQATRYYLQHHAARADGVTGAPDAEPPGRDH